VVDSAVSPTDGPTKLEQRQAADRDDRDNRYDDDRDNTAERYEHAAATKRQAGNVRAYHQSEIDRLTRAIEQHQAIVDAQDEILSHPSNRGRDDGRGGRGGVEDGTDIGDLFNRDPSSPDADPEANVDGADEGGDEGGTGTSDSSTPSDQDVTSTPATPADDDEVKGEDGSKGTGAPGRPLSGTTGLTGPGTTEEAEAQAQASGEADKSNPTPTAKPPSPKSTRK
jgi:hypothetical protein